ncbi:MAG: glycosyltransferase family 4 protein [Syntrophomonadaceae bacterium]|nr:glycosyltransferase family 4 protein [Syntrophomonadaceae bacterium]
MEKTTVLLALMGLDIGGAETHAVVLARHLQEMGYKVVIASNGGVYEEQIRLNGIKHYHVNLTSRNPLTAMQSVCRLCRLVKQERIDLIHAHARIPAFLCNIVSRYYHIPFITTAHAAFRSNFLLRWLSVWGEYTIAVSNDIKEYLTRTFAVNPDQITVIYNGIDAEVFTPQVDYGPVARELGLNENCRKIVCVTRLDNQLADVVLHLIDAVELLSKQYSPLALVVAGSGNRLREVLKYAREKNKALGRNVIHVLGKRTDIAQLVNMATVFVGISRAAMEAMACEKPVVLAGWWSFIGLLEPDKVPILKENNFTGRSFSQPVTPRLLADEIARVFELDEAELRNQGKWNRGLILEEYSSKAMAEETAAVYESILSLGVRQ